MYEPSSSLKAIETYFDGHHYRSRLEARWAMFFKSLHIPFLYEAEGFQLVDGLWYLPDFWLPAQDCFFEVKGPFTLNEGPKKAAYLADASGKMVYIFKNIPKADGYSTGEDEGGEAFFPRNGYDFGYRWCRKPCCGKLGIQFDGRSARIPCECPDRDKGDKGYAYDHITLEMAYMAARCHRFDGGM